MDVLAIFFSLLSFSNPKSIQAEFVILFDKTSFAKILTFGLVPYKMKPW